MLDATMKMTIREYFALMLLKPRYTTADVLRERWTDTGYPGVVHDVLYKLERRGLAERAAAPEYFATGSKWRMTDDGQAVVDDVNELFATLRRRLPRKR